MEDNNSITFNDFDVDGCNISEVILFLQNLALSPNASSMNVAFTKHITNALMQIREDKLKQKVSIPRKLEDGSEPIIKMNVNDFYCNALCDLGASISVTKAAKERILEKSYNPRYGARPIRREIQKSIEDPLSEIILGAEDISGAKITVDTFKGEVRVKLVQNID